MSLFDLNRFPQMVWPSRRQKDTPSLGLPSPCLTGRSWTRDHGHQGLFLEGHHTQVLLTPGAHPWPRLAWLVQCQGQGGRATLVQPSGALSPHSSANGHTAWSTCPHTRTRCSKRSQILTSKVTSRANPAMPLPGIQGLWAHSGLPALPARMSPSCLPQWGL